VEAGFIPMAQISENFSTPHTFELRPWGEIKKGYTHVRNGDVALAKITPCFENGKSTIIAGLPNEIGAGTTEIHVVRPIMVDPSYILLFLNSPFFVLNGIPRMTGTAGQKRLPTHYFSHFPFPLPPLPEQKRIVRKVQHLMSLCDQLAVALNGSSELTDKFTRSVVSTLA
jgi:type I restriction enzyme S subunit